MKSVLVTGGAGFIGSNFVHHLLEKHDYSVTILDKLTYAGNMDNLKDVIEDERVTFVKGDVCDPAAVGDCVREADCVVHFAAETHVDRSILDAGVFVQTDVFGTFVMLEAARKRGISKFLHISTDEVYGEAGAGPSKETDPLMPKSPYAASKAGADRLAYSYYVTYGVPVVITRCTNNYGPYQHPEKLIPLFVTNAMKDKELPVYGTGENTRDWINVRDHCEVLDTLMHKDGLEGEVFNVGSGVEKSVLDIAGSILAELDKPESLLKHVEDRKGHVVRHAVSTSKIRERLGWEPRSSFKDGMKATIQWYLDNEWWWSKVKDKKFEDYYQALHGKAE
ncbi:MAG: dTDP-glucose 4,6-dehydratase [Methanobacteriota archaeon]|nr:MAG: dTDP-glucose 4,6-dehydratase [Euryarchaeota archaeon]